MLEKILNKKKPENVVSNEAKFDFGYSEDNNKMTDFEKNVRTLKDCFAPSSISAEDPTMLKIGDKYCKNFIMQGYPTIAYMNWLDDLYSYDGDMDVAVLVEHKDDMTAVNELTKQITALTSQRDMEYKEGNISNIQIYNDKIAELEQQKMLLTKNIESMYNIGIFANLFNDNPEKLKKAAEMLKSTMKGKSIDLLSTDYRMLNGFKTTMPLGKNFFGEKLRNFTTGGVVASMPFTKGEMYDPNGVWFGRNLTTGNKIMIDVYNKNFINNTNMLVVGMAGSGKTYAMSLLGMRYATQGVQTIIVDQIGEYAGLAKSCGGINIVIAPDSRAMINLFELESAYKTDDDGNIIGDEFIDLNTKYGDVIDLLMVMAEEADAEERSLISSVVVKLYKNFGFTTDVKSLYDENGNKKRMPTFSDFYELLCEEIDKIAQNTTGNSRELLSLEKMQNKLKRFKKGEAYPMFDCESTVNTEYFKNAPVINFDISSVAENKVLRPIATYIAGTYIWEKILKRDLKSGTYKRVIFDEAWMLFSPSFSDMANAFDLPGIPMRSLYVGFNVSTLNSNAPFLTPTFERAYLLSSG